MKHYRNFSIASLMAVATLGSIGNSKPVFAGEEFRAINVNTVIPPKTYSGFLESVPANGDPLQFLGPKTGFFGITNITLTNTDRAIAQFVGIATPASCEVSGPVSAQLFYVVQPNSTLVVTFPTPYVTNLTGGGQPCITAFHFSGISLGATLILMVSGVVNDRI